MADSTRVEIECTIEVWNPDGTLDQSAKGTIVFENLDDELIAALVQPDEVRLVNGEPEDRQQHL